MLQQNTKTDIQDFNEDMEQQVFTPLLEMAHSLGQQFETEEMFLAITGRQKQKFTPQMLVEDYSWMWVASSQAINQQIRGQQLGNFLQVILNPTVLQMLMQKGLSINIENILRKMWEDGLGQRSFESLIDSSQMMPGMPGQPQPMPGQPQLSPEQISSVSQNPNGGPIDPTAGEGEQFRQVRSEAEDISGIMGQLGNMAK